MSSSSARQLFPFNTPKLMFSLAPARCNGTWHRVSDGEAERPFSPRLPSCCWRPRGRRPAGRRRRGEPLSTERSRRSAPLDTFDQHISIRFHIRTPAFCSVGTCILPLRLAKVGGAQENAVEISFFFESDRLANTWQPDSVLDLLLFSARSLPSRSYSK